MSQSQPPVVISVLGAHLESQGITYTSGVERGLAYLDFDVLPDYWGPSRRMRWGVRGQGYLSLEISAALPARLIGQLPRIALYLASASYSDSHGHCCLNGRRLVWRSDAEQFDITGMQKLAGLWLNAGIEAFSQHWDFAIQVARRVDLDPQAFENWVVNDCDPDIDAESFDFSWLFKSHRLGPCRPGTFIKSRN